MAAMSPLGRLGDPADVADVIALLAGPDGRWMTGQNLPRQRRPPVTTHPADTSAPDTGLLRLIPQYASRQPQLRKDGP